MCGTAALPACCSRYGSQDAHRPRVSKEAERVRQIAEAAASEVVKAQLLDVAQQFEDLAAQAETDNAAPHDR
jgi:hypothetical protein